MVGEIWLNDDGDIVLDEDGNRFICDNCPCGCPEALEITLAGVDAGICPPCIRNGGGNFTPLTLSIDGVWSLTYQGTFSGLCVYEFDDKATVWGTGEYYFFGTPCPAGPPDVVDSKTFAIGSYVAIGETDRLVKQIQLYLGSNSQMFYNDATGVSLGATVSNQRVCAQHDGTYSSGGTAVVVKE